MSWYYKHDDKTWYTLTESIGFYLPDLKLPDMIIRTLKGDIIADVSRGLITIHKGYSWDGCTVIGLVYENAETLRASALHDLLYQLSEQWPDYVIPYDRDQADQAFASCLSSWRKYLYYLGVLACGRYYFGDQCKSLDIQEL